MTKRRDIIKTMRNAAKKAGLEVSLSEGGNHSLLDIDGLVIPIPRHSEVREPTATTIYKEAAIKLGKEWWKR